MENLERLWSLRMASCDFTTISLTSRHFATLGAQHWSIHCRLKAECVYTRVPRIHAFLLRQSGRRLRYGSGGTALAVRRMACDRHGPGGSTATDWETGVLTC